MNQNHWIPTFSDYIKDYILDFGGRHIPGEHHFVSMYLVPRLVSFEFLGLPCFVNPDGMKAIPGDIVFYDPADSQRVTPRLGIEVKIGSLRFSRTEYNDWMRPNAPTGAKPHLFVGISKDGMLIGRWAPFADRFARIVYPDGAPEMLNPKRKADRYTLERGLLKIVTDPEAVLVPQEHPLPSTMRWWAHSNDGEIAQKNESDALAFLLAECRLASRQGRQSSPVNTVTDRRP